MSITTQTALQWSEQGYLPDRVIRLGIQRMLAERLIEIQHNDCESMADTQSSFIQNMKDAPIALVPDKANEQHYEVPASFYDLVLGKYRKYSCCYWSEKTFSLDDAEQNALIETCQNAKLENGQNVLELGCGWGSLSLWMAENYPESNITAVSNSNSQREHIEATASERGIKNLRVITCDMNDFDIDGKYDRIVSVEMFEHMRNWQTLYRNINRWLKDDGLFFKHVFVNRAVPYLFMELDESDWMSRHFFSGGMMPSDDLPLHFQQALTLERQWRWQGEHYEKTSNAWLSNMDKNKDAVWSILEDTYGVDQAQKWWMRWRMFFMACAELFAYNNGQEWYVSHYLFSKKSIRT